MQRQSHDKNDGQGRPNYNFFTTKMVFFALYAGRSLLLAGALPPFVSISTQNMVVSLTQMMITLKVESSSVASQHSATSQGSETETKCRRPCRTN